MPRKTKTTAPADKAAQSQFSAELLAQLIPGPVTPAELEGIFQQFKKSVLQRAQDAQAFFSVASACPQRTFTIETSGHSRAIC